MKNYCMVAKIKGLAQESQIIRSKKEKALSQKDTKLFYNCYNALNQLSVDARHHLLAYAFIRDIPYKKVENKSNKPIDVKKLLQIVQVERVIFRSISSIIKGEKKTIKTVRLLQDDKMEILINEWLKDETYKAPIQPLRPKGVYVPKVSS
jgi:hypothetical protein